MLFCDLNVCSAAVLLPLGNSDNLLFSHFPFTFLNPKRDAPFHRTVYDYSRAEWDGFQDYIRDVPREDVFEVGASASASGICGGFR